MDSFTEISLFASIVKHGNLAAAAQEFGLTPPAVSRRLRNLEKRLCVRLLNRTTRKISLTSEGELYLMEGVKILREMTALEGRLVGTTSKPQGCLRVAATLGFGRTMLAPALSRFAKRYPELEVQLHLSDKSVNLVDQGFDLMVRFGEPSDSRLTARLLARNRRILCATAAYLRAAGVPEHPRELGKHHCIFIREGDEAFGTWHLRNGALNETVKVRSNLSTNDGSTALAWALDHHGILVRSQWELAPLIRTASLVPVLPEWSHPNADIHLVYQANRQTPAKVRVLVEFLLAEFSSHRGHERGVTGSW